MATKSPEERYQWIMSYLERQPPRVAVDVLDSEFVTAYSVNTGAPVKTMMYGAPKCKMLGRDLRAMHRAMLLKRNRTSITGMGGMGFPTWVWSYQLGRVS